MQNRMIFNSGACEKHGHIMCTTCTINDLRDKIEDLERQNQKIKEDFREFKMKVLETIASAQTESDAEGWITSYHFKTGLIHRLIKEAKD